MEDRSFEEFYVSEYKGVLALARVLTRDLAHAEDVAHDSFAAALEDWDTITNPEGWIRAVVANKARSMWRRRFSERRALERMRVGERIGRDLAADTEDFWGEVRRLPRQQAQAVALYYLEDRPVAEIAVILGCKESTARVHLMRGRRTLARRLGANQ